MEACTCIRIILSLISKEKLGLLWRIVILILAHYLHLMYAFNKMSNVSSLYIYIWLYVVSDLAWCEYWDVLSNHTKQNYLQMLQIRSAMHKVSLWSCERLLQQSNPSFLRQSGLKNKNYVYFQTNVEQNLTILYQFKSLIRYLPQHPEDHLYGV